MTVPVKRKRVSDRGTGKGGSAGWAAVSWGRRTLNVFITSVIRSAWYVSLVDESVDLSQIVSSGDNVRIHGEEVMNLCRHVPFLNRRCASSTT